MSNQQQLEKEFDLDEAVLSCQVQDDNQISDIANIKEALSRYNQEASYLINKVKSLNSTKKHDIVKTPFYSYPSENQCSCVELDDISERSQLLRECCELMDSYPESSFDENSTREEVESYYDASETHHEKVLMIAGCLLPDLSSLLNESKIKHDRSTKFKF